MILETNRLILRPLTEEDFDAWTAVLGDPEVMYAYEHGFSPEEVRQWIERQQERYAKDGFGLWALIEKTSGQLIGDCGITLHVSRVPEDEKTPSGRAGGRFLYSADKLGHRPLGGHRLRGRRHPEPAQPAQPERLHHRQHPRRSRCPGLWPV